MSSKFLNKSLMNLRLTSIYPITLFLILGSVVKTTPEQKSYRIVKDSVPKPSSQCYSIDILCHRKAAYFDSPGGVIHASKHSRMYICWRPSSENGSAFGHLHGWVADVELFERATTSPQSLEISFHVRWSMVMIHDPWCLTLTPPSIFSDRLHGIPVLVCNKLTLNYICRLFSGSG
jgi:hypothetical protein